MSARRSLIELFLGGVSLLLVITTLVLGFKLHWASRDIGAVMQSDFGFSAGQTAFDFYRLREIAHRSALGDPSLPADMLERRVDVLQTRIEVLTNETRFRLGDDAKEKRAKRLIDMLLKTNEPILAAMADPACDPSCRGRRIVEAIGRIERPLGRFSTLELLRDADLRTSMLATIGDLARVFFAVGALAVMFCALFVAYLVQRNRALDRQREEIARISDYRAQFLAGLSHEFRTPLNAIIGFTQIMKMRGPAIGRKTMNEYCGHVLSAAGDLEELTNGVLDLSKVDAGSIVLAREDIDLDALVESVCLQLSMRAKRSDIALERSVTPGLRLDADPNALKRCIANLVTNSLKFSPAGSTVTIRAEHIGEFIELSVQDHGVGIPQDEIEAVWHAYARSSYTRQNDREGTGLGLSITRALVEAHGGHARIRSAQGRGTTVTLCFPAALSDESAENGEGSAIVASRSSRAALQNGAEAA